MFFFQIDSGGSGDRNPKISLVDGYQIAARRPLEEKTTIGAKKIVLACVLCTEHLSTLSNVQKAHHFSNASPINNKLLSFTNKETVVTRGLV